MMQVPRTRQITLEEILDHEIDVSAFQRHNGPITGTVTTMLKEVPERLLRTIDIDRLIDILESFYQKYKALACCQRESLYSTFHIPKKSGGLRTINAPCDELMGALRELKMIFESDFFALYHTSAFAYIPNRQPADALRRHQANGSKWFLKIDFSNFFGSTTPDFLFSMLARIFPFSEVARVDRGEKALRNALDLCFLNGGLPQGTPISPMLTNLMMIPIDHRIANDLHDGRFIYTRYADDINISSSFDFNYIDKVNYISKVLSEFQAPFEINCRKTHYGSSAGSNWSLGLMLNKDNNITIGWKNVERFKAMCHSYITDRLNGRGWDRYDIQKFNGLISYYCSIERDYINHIINHYNQKYHVNLKMMIREDLSGHGR